MEVDFDTGYGPQILVRESDLITDRTLNAPLSGNIINGPSPVSVRFPQDAIGKRVRVSFGFSSIDGGTNDPSYGWMVDEIKVVKRIRTRVDDVVSRNYDSAELASSYSISNPVLDLTFDVPGTFQDRSPASSPVRAVAADSAVGVSGRGAKLSESSTIYADNVYPIFGKGLTVEMWANPDSYEKPGVRPL